MKSVKDKLEQIGAKKLDKRHLSIFNEDCLLEEINPEYGYYLHATIHIPIDSTNEEDSIEYKFSRVILHRYFSHKEFDANNNDSRQVFEGYIRSGQELENTLKQLGILEYIR